MPTATTKRMTSIKNQKRAATASARAERDRQEILDFWNYGTGERLRRLRALLLADEPDHIVADSFHTIGPEALELGKRMLSGKGLLPQRRVGRKL